MLTCREGERRDFRRHGPKMLKGMDEHLIVVQYRGNRVSDCRRVIQRFKVLRTSCYFEEEVLGSFIFPCDVAKLSAPGN